ncbi:MAG: NADH-quinone oxidoreductase subunit I [Anaerolineae bacterium]|nr:MAG: NADH-quinone oxidoreductase subunit I [Anaerolineae bacterium]
MLGKGVLKGMRVTIGRFVDTFVEDIGFFLRNGRASQKALEYRIRADTKGLKTIEYPEQKVEMFEGFRVIPFLVYDESAEDPRCTACGICARVCPPQCIWIERDQTPEGRPMKRPRNFTIDATVCMSCGLCAEFCPFDAIKMDNNYELSAYDRLVDLVFHKDRLLRPVEYFAKVSPTQHQAIEEEKRRKEEAKRKAAAARAAKAGS